MKLKLQALTAALVVLTTSSVFAQDPTNAPSRPERPERPERPNGEGEGRGEAMREQVRQFMEHMKAILRRIDRDNDGAISEDEWEKAKEHLPKLGEGTLFEKADANNDGKVTKEEFRAFFEAHRKQFFDHFRERMKNRADGNDNGGTAKN